MATTTIHCDVTGNVYNTGNNYATIQAAATGDGNSTSVVSVGQNRVLNQRRIYRGFLRLDASAIPDDATITAAKLRLCCKDNYSTGDFNATLLEGTQGDSIANDDYDEFESTSFGTWNSGSYSDENYIEITLNASGIAAISKTGYSYFCLRSDRDIAATDPSVSEYVDFYCHSDTDKEPEFEITYTETDEILISGGIAGVVSVTGDVEITRTISGTIAATTGLFGTAVRDIGISGTIAAVSSVSGEISLSGILEVSGTISAISGMVGSLQFDTDVIIAGSITASSSMTGAIVNTREITGTIAAVASLTARLRNIPAIDPKIAIKVTLADDSEILFYKDEVSTVEEKSETAYDIMPLTTTPVKTAQYGQLFRTLNVQFLEATGSTRAKVEQLVDEMDEMTIYFAVRYFAYDRYAKVILIPDGYEKEYVNGEKVAWATHLLSFLEYEK